MMIEQAIILTITFLIPPVLGLVILIVILALIGKSLGIRRAYVSILVQIFQWASAKLEHHEQNRRIEESSDEEDESKPVFSDRHRSPSGKNLIQKDATLRIMRKISINENDKNEGLSLIDDSLDFIKAAVESIIDDEVTSRFSAEQLTSWNLLTRTSLGYQYTGLRMTVLWVTGFLFRYCILFPVRFIVFIIGLLFLIVSTAFVGCVPDGPFKRMLNRRVSIISYRILCRAVSAIVTYHNQENMAKSNGICVANHTSPIDVMILSCDNCYALVGQRQGGLLGILQRALNRASAHIWFERSEVNDRLAVSRRLREHVEDIDKLPILIFPEGTCINNTSVMMFKKGSFEVGGLIYPAAVKYDARFCDAFWNSSKQSYVQYMMMMMTSWAIVADVYYLPPMTKQEGETAIAFAARVRKAIAEKGGLVELEWDGQLKRFPVKPEMIEKQRERYSRRIISSSANLDKQNDNKAGSRRPSKDRSNEEKPTENGGPVKEHKSDQNH